MSSVQSNTQYVSLSDVIHFIPAARSTIGKWIRDGRFPAPLPLPSRRRLWYRSEISAWLRNNGLEPLPDATLPE